MSAQILNTIGLLLDIVGVIILFRYTLPDAIRRSGLLMARNIDVVGSEDELTPEEREEDRVQMAQERKWRRSSARWSWSGLLCLVTGFLMQIVAAWL